MDRVARRGPLARAPGALKRGGDTSEIVNIFVAVEGGLFGEETNFRKKSHNAEKQKGGTFGVFNIHSVAKHQKLNWENFSIFGKKSHNAEKTERDTLWDFLTSKIFRKKVSQCRKKIKRGDSLVSPCMVCYAGKQENPFWFSSVGRMVQIGAIIFLELLRTILVSSCGLKKNH